MKTLFDQVAATLDERSIHSMSRLLESYDSEKHLARCYATFAYLCGGGAGGNRAMCDALGELIESFYLATSIHDDVVDAEDLAVQGLRQEFSANTFMVLGNCFFVKLGSALARVLAEVQAEHHPRVLERYHRFMFDVAESQIVDEESHFETPSKSAAERQMKLRGGTWGRFCMELPAVAGGLNDDDATRLGDAGERLFLALTIRDDLRDLTDDILNGVLTLAPAIFFTSDNAPLWNEKRRIDSAQAANFIQCLYDQGAILQALERGREHTREALNILDEFLDERSDMHWYLLLMLFRLMVKQFAAFTPDHVIEGKLSIGISEPPMRPFESA